MPDPLIPPNLDLGHVKEGVVELDPVTGRMVIRSEARSGGFEYFDVQDALTAYQGEEVRVIIVPQRTINTVADMVEEGSVQPDQVPSAGRS
jgi:hypothetical protein